MRGAELDVANLIHLQRSHESSYEREGSFPSMAAFAHRHISRVHRGSSDLHRAFREQRINGVKRGSNSSPLGRFFMAY